MAQPSPTACRFYHAFYRWNVLSHSSTRIPRKHRTSPPSISPFYHTKHFSSAIPCSQAAHAELQSHGSHPTNDHPTVPNRKHDSLRFRIRQGRQQKHNDLFSLPVTTSAQCPLDELGLWEDVVRYRSTTTTNVTVDGSETAMMMIVQTAVPLSRAKYLGQTYGKDLRRMGEQLFGRPISVRVEASSDVIEKRNAAGRTVDIVGVLYSGSAEQVERVREVLRGAEFGIKGKDNETELAGIQRKGPGRVSIEQKGGSLSHNGNRWSFTPRPVAGEMMPRSTSPTPMVQDGPSTRPAYTRIENKSTRGAERGAESFASAKVKEQGRKERVRAKQGAGMPKAESAGRTVVPLPVYSRLAIPSHIASYVFYRVSSLKGIHLEVAKEGTGDEEQAAETYLTMSARTRGEVEGAKGILRRTVEELLVRHSSELDADAVIRIIQEGERIADTAPRLPDGEALKDVGLHRFCKFVLPDSMDASLKAKRLVTHADESFVLCRGHRYKESPVGGDYLGRRYAVWGATWEDVRAGMVAVRDLVDEFNKGQSGEEVVSLTILEEGSEDKSRIAELEGGEEEEAGRAGDAPISVGHGGETDAENEQSGRLQDVGKGDTADKNVSSFHSFAAMSEEPERTLNPEPKHGVEAMQKEAKARAAAHVRARHTSPDPSSVLAHASRGDHARGDVSPFIPLSVESKKRVRSPAPATSFLNGDDDVEAPQDSALPLDDLIFPEFYPEHLRPVTRATTRNAKQPIQQQRAYSTGQRPNRIAKPRTGRNEDMDNSEEADTATTAQRDQLAEDVKRALRVLTHPVVLVTSSLAEPSDPNKPATARFDLARGVTISSFTTVTLNPVPMISFNLRVPSRSWDAILASRRICVHLLAATPRGAALAHPFTQPHDKPSEPFRRLERLGVRVNMVQRGRGDSGAAASGNAMAEAPRLHWDGAVLAHLTARLDMGKCVSVGDHVIVVAEVTGVEFARPRQDWTDGVGLAYMMKGYRGIEASIEPVEVPMLEEVEKGWIGKTSDAEDDGVRAANDASLHSTSGDDSISAEVGTATRFEVNVQAGPDRGVSFHGADEVDQASRRARPKIQDQSQPQSSLVQAEPQASLESYFKQFEQVEDEDDPNEEASSSDLKHSPPSTSTPRTRRGGPKRGSQQPWGITTSSKRFYSTLSCGQRHFSRTSRSCTTYSLSSGQDTRHQADKFSIHSLVSDPELLSCTVGDFLDIPENDYIPPPRMRALLLAQKEAHQASQQLHRSLANGSLTAEESARLERIVQRNEQRVAKTLALRSAKDLRRMLDKGRVDHRRAQWLESSIEKGQVVILDEARQLRRMVEDGSIGAEQFAQAKETLQQQNQVLTDEATRLRQMVDEEGEGGGPLRDAQGFDGFRGNV